MSEGIGSPEQIPLSAEDLEAIRTACASPPEPGPALLRAAERYRERVRSGLSLSARASETTGASRPSRPW